jgi:hypothetical protein
LILLTERQTDVFKKGKERKEERKWKRKKQEKEIHSYILFTVEPG